MSPERRCSRNRSDDMQSFDLAQKDFDDEVYKERVEAKARTILAKQAEELAEREVARLLEGERAILWDDESIDAAPCLLRLAKRWFPSSFLA